MIIPSVMLLWLLQGSVDTCLTSMPHSQLNRKNNIISSIANTSSGLSNNLSTTSSTKGVSTTSLQDRVSLESPNILKTFKQKTIFRNHTIPPVQVETPRQTDAPSVVLQGLLIRFQPQLVEKKVLEKQRKSQNKQ